MASGENEFDTPVLNQVLRKHLSVLPMTFCRVNHKHFQEPVMYKTLCKMFGRYDN